MSGPVALSIGNFDGVHLGHAALVSAARRAVGPSGRVVILSFDPHPVTVLRPGESRPRLTRFEERAALLEARGANEVVRLEPTPELLALSPDGFVARLVEAYEPSVIVEGVDFRFGLGRSGSVDTLRALEDAYGFRTVVVDTVEVPLVNHHLVSASSTMIRWLLERGRLRDAAALLGRPVELTGTVVQGEQRGRVIGVPTANLDCGDLLLPADGIYAGCACRDDVWYPAAISVGTNPTFDDEGRRCEAHLLEYGGPLDDYGWTLRLQFTHWLRDQIRYDGVDPLVAQLARDIERTRILVASRTEPTPA